jgi:kynurenine 3-monooxygenase
LTSFDALTANATFIRDTDGSEKLIDLTQYDAVFASDGGGSVVRNSLHTAGLIESSETKLSAGYKEVVFPPTPNGRYSLDPHSLHIWARNDHMMMALANTDGSFTGTLYMDSTGSETSFESVCNSRPSAEKFLSKYYQTALEHMDIDDAVSNLVNFKEGILGTVRCSSWSALGRAKVPICLIGDAAHAIVPFFGQGVNSGFEDVYVLDDIIAREEDNKSWATVMSEFWSRRKPDTDAIALLALENFMEMRSRVVDNDFQEMKKIENHIMSKFPSLYRSRYTLVMYSYNSYAAVRELGMIQEKFLSSLVKSPPMDDVELEVKIKEEISPHVERLKICLDF